MSGGYTAYGLGYFDGILHAARTYEPSPSIAHAVASYIAAFGECPTSVTMGGRIVWRSRFRIGTEVGNSGHAVPVMRHTKQ